MAEYGHSKWKGSTGGTPWMQRTLVHLAGALHPSVLYCVVAVVIPFYMLFAGSGYRASYSFYRRRLGFGPFKSFVGVYRNFFSMGKIVIDRFAMYGGRSFKFKIEENNCLSALCEEEKGFVIASSHVGNFELAGYSLSLGGKRLNALVYAKETQAVMEGRQEMFSRHNIRMVPVSPDLQHLFTVSTALSDGEIVAVPADRLFGSEKSQRCLFFGEEAPFPAGPYALAGARDVPVVAVFVMKTGVTSYSISAVKVEDAASFAAALENTVRLYPYQWFNFFNFWE